MTGAYFTEAIWPADDTTEEAMTVTPPKQPSTTLVAYCPECFGMRMILCRENIVSDRPQAYWFACSDCGVETTHAPTLSAVRDLVRWVPIDATLD
jgi:hypothetical protein